jgi:hypothetical protein
MRSWPVMPEARDGRLETMELVARLSACLKRASSLSKSAASLGNQLAPKLPKRKAPARGWGLGGLGLLIFETTTPSRDRQYND